VILGHLLADPDRFVVTDPVRIAGSTRSTSLCNVSAAVYNDVCEIAILAAQIVRA